MDGNATTELFIYIILLVVPLAAYGVYYFTSAYVNKKNGLDRPIEQSPFRKFTIKIDTLNGVYTFLYRGNNAVPTSYNKQRFEDLMATDDDLKNWRLWLKKARKSDGFPPEITLNVKTPEKLAAAMRVALSHYNEETGVLYIQGEYAPATDLSQISQSAAIDAFDFRGRLNAILKESKYPTGTMIIVNFNRYEYVKRRYSATGAQKYLAALWSYFASFDNGVDAAAGIYQNDSFILYGKNIRTRKDVQAIVDALKSRVAGYVSGTGYEIEVDPKVGYSSFGEFTSSPEAVARQAYNASLVAIETKAPIKHYDSDLEKEYQNKMWLVMLLREKIKRNLLKPVYQTIVSLHTGQPIGSIGAIDFASTEFKTLANADKIAVANGFGNDLLETMVSVVVSGHKNDEKTKDLPLFFFIPARIMEQTIALLRRKEEYKGLKMVLVVEDYEQLIARAEYARAATSAPEGTQLGVVASAKMETTVHPILNNFTYVIWPNSLIDDILVDNKDLVTFRNIYETTSGYNLISIAYQVNSYDIAEFLKENGEIVNMTGPIFGFDYQSSRNYSVRRFKKLIGAGD